MQRIAHRLELPLQYRLQNPHLQNVFSINIGETESFKEEIPTLKHCGNKNARANGRSRLWNAQRIGFPSRQTAFKSPGYLSVNIDKPTQSNGKQLGRHSSTPSPHNYDGSIPSSSVKKEVAPCFRPSNVSQRNNQKTVVLVDEEDLDVTDQVDQSTSDTKIYYPSRYCMCCSFISQRYRDFLPRQMTSNWMILKQLKFATQTYNARLPNPIFHEPS